MVAKLFLAAGPPLPSQASSQGRIGSEPLKCRSQGPAILGGNQITRDVVDHHLPGAINVETDDRLAGQEPVNEGPGKPFPQAGMDDDIHGGHQAGDFLRRDQSHEQKMPFQPGRTNLPFELVPQHAVAHEEKSRQRLGANQTFCRFDQVLVALEVKQAGRSCQ